MSAVPAVSAIVPVYNGAAYIADALRSIRAQLHPVSELIVVDDGSTDATADLVSRADPDAALVRQSRGGLSSARNTGAQKASGEWLAFLDHDDLWPPDRIGALLDGIAASPEAGLVCGRIRIEEMHGAIADPRMRKASGSHVPFLVHSTLIRRSVWMVLGGMNTAFDLGQDLDFYLRLTDSGVKIAKVDATTLIYRQHGSNRSRAVELGNSAMLVSLRASIDRRRKTAR